MASFTAVRNGLKTRLETITSPAWQVYARPPDDVVWPCAVITPGTPAIAFDATMGRGSDELFLVVTVLVADVYSELAQDRLDGYLGGSGSSSVKAAIEADGTLGGIVSFTVVPAVIGYGDIEWAGARYLGAQFSVEVMT